MLAPQRTNEPALQSGGAPGASVCHLAIIMDGNGRWAERHGISRLEGHRAGVEAARRTVQAARDLGIRAVTLYSFSTENWSRPDWEVRHLLGLLRRFFKEDLQELAGEGVRVRVLGDHASLPKDLLALVEEAEAETRGNVGFTLQIAFNYGGRDEIVRAAAKLAEQVAAGTVRPEEVTEALLSAQLDTAGVPDPDIVIRTSGEQRLSNFLLWQAAYAELIFADCLWPDFGRADLEAALAEFARRERRYGGRKGEAATAP